MGEDERGKRAMDFIIMTIGGGRFEQVNGKLKCHKNYILEIRYIHDDRGAYVHGKIE